MSRTPWYQMTAEEALRALAADPGKGLDWNEVERRRRNRGENKLEESSRIHPAILFIQQFRDFMVLVLLAATLISGLLGEYSDAITIMAIVFLNGILGFVQEYRAEHSLQALKKLTAPECDVIREGRVERIPAVELVPGDLVRLESGDRVPADLRLLRVAGLYIEESSLTGESVPVAKDIAPIPLPETGIGDRRNMAFMGSMVTQGSGLGLVVETGMGTEMGRIAHLISQAEEEATPLQRRLRQLGKVLVAACLLLTLFIVGLGLWQGQGLYEMVLAGVSLAVAAIPEGLPAIVTVALALGVQRMIRRKAIVRRLPSVETLGCATVICSDKTGTLTQNRMTVTHIWQGGELLQVEGGGYLPQGNFRKGKQRVEPERRWELKRMLEVAALCNNAELQKEEGQKGLLRRKEGEWRIQGDPTEGALLVMAAKAGLWKDELQERWRRLHEHPFDPRRKMMSVVVEDKQRGRWLFVKGAPDLLLERCRTVVVQGKEIPLNLGLRREVLGTNEELASMALRNLGLAYRRIAPGEGWEERDSLEQGLTFLGLAAMIDPPRPEVRQAILTCKKAGIRTVMITGDHQTTAEAIALQLGMLPPGGLVTSGKELDRLREEEWLETVGNTYVFARVSPEHKLRIVQALKAKGEIVAMTGDGVNDAPAIKSADIGIAMGVTGTDVAKEASDLVLADDNFATIVAAVEEGRGIYENIRKFIRYMLASNVGEILTMLFAMLWAMPLPLLPIQILWVNLVTDGLPAMALGVDPAEEDVMRRPPRNSRESVFARGLWWKILSRGFLIGLVTAGAFWLSLTTHPGDLERARTVAFATLVMAQLIHVFDCRNATSIFARHPFGNRWLLLAVLVSLAMLLAVLYVPELQTVFHTVGLNTGEWLTVLLAAAIPTFALSLNGLLKNR